MPTLAPVRRIVAVLIACGAIVVAGDGRADDKAACTDAYEHTQSLKTSGKLQAAREQASQCTRTVCTAFIRADCARWLAEIEAAQPTVVFEVKDAKGRDASAVRVSLDGAPWLAEIDGQTKPVDPGHHTLRFEMAGAPPLEQQIVVREQEKGRRVRVSFKSGDAAIDARVGAARPTALPWILGGVGIALAGVGVVLGFVTLSAKSRADDLCPNGVCPNNSVKTEAESSRSTVNTVGPISTVGMVSGGVAIGAAVVWLATRNPARPSATGLFPTFAPGNAGVARSEVASDARGRLGRRILLCRAPRRVRRLGAGVLGRLGRRRLRRRRFGRRIRQRRRDRLHRDERLFGAGLRLRQGRAGPLPRPHPLRDVQGADQNARRASGPTPCRPASRMRPPTK